MIKIQINKICAKLIECEPLTSGMIGKTVEVEFSAEWSELNKIAVFSNGDVTIDVLESQWNGNTITIPQEVLATPHRSISMGVYGYELVDGEKVLAIPTIVAEIGKTKFGADPSGDPEADPTLPIWAQLQWEIDHFEVDPELIAEQVQLYLAEHPITISPATASVLGGIKVGANLSITADGTLSADAVDLSGYATEAWVLAKNYLTQHQSLAAYRTAAAQDIIDASKQDTIADLASIRSGAALGATALQSVPNTYRTAAQQDIIDNGKQVKALIVNITGSGGTYTADKTNAEIYAAWQAGREVIAELSSNKLRCVSATANAAYFTEILEVETASISIENNVVTATVFDLQPKTIADSAGYYTTDTVEGALAEIGAELAGINTLVGSGVIV